MALRGMIRLSGIRVSAVFFGLYDALPPPQIWEENEGTSYSLNVAYLTRSVGEGVAEERVFFPILLL